MITITGMEDFVTSIRIQRCGDAGGHRAAVAVHGGTPGTSEIAHASAYLIDAAWHATLIGSSEPSGKDMFVDFELDGTTLRMFVAEAVPFGSGTTGRPDVYEFPNSVPLGVASTGGDTWLRARVSAFMAGLRDLAARYV